MQTVKLYLFPEYQQIQSDCPFGFKRLQFPVKLFRCDISEAQVQSLKEVDTDLQMNVVHVDGLLNRRLCKRLKYITGAHKKKARNVLC
jgi:hypothetical protein